MKYTETEGALHIKGFDLNFCFVNGLSAFIISLVGLLFCFIYSLTPYVGPKIFGFFFFILPFLYLVYLFLGYLFLEICVMAHSIKIKFLWRIWEIQDREIKIRLQNSYRPTGWIITFYFDSGRISLPILKKDKALAIIDKIKFYYKNPINIVDYQNSLSKS